MPMQWLTASYDSTISGNDVQRTLHVQVPALARCVRFQARNVSVDGWAAGVDPTQVFAVGVHYEVRIVFGFGFLAPFHMAYQGYRAIPMQMTSLFDSTAPLPNQRFHYAWYSAGDNELGINQKVSYGGAGHEDFGVDLLYRLSRPSLGSNGGTYKFSITWAVLADVPESP